MRKENNIFSGKGDVDAFKKYEALQIVISYFECSDVLTASTGTADDDNVGGFLDAWRA